MVETLVRAIVASTFFVSPCAITAQAASKQSDQSYPTRPVRLIVPFAPGGTNDVLARMVATHLTSTLGQPMIVDNRTGAEGVIGTDLAVKAAPDGYTLLMVSAAYS